MWEPIRLLREKGCRTLSFGRTDAGDSGLLQFKRGWGAAESGLQYQRMGIQSALRGPAGKLSPKSEIPSRLMGCLSIPILRGIGALVYPNLA
jgi:hypothetical protein